MDLFDDDFELEDFALIGGLIGAVEEEMEEERERERLEHDLWPGDESDKESEENE